MGGKGQEGNRHLSEDKHNAVATDRKDVHWRMNVRSIPLLVRVLQWKGCQSGHKRPIEIERRELITCRQAFGLQ